MSDPLDLPFTYLRDLFDDVEEPSEPTGTGVGDEQQVAARAAMLDATANVLAAMRELLQTAEDVVRLRRERLTDTDASAPAAPTDPTAGNVRQRIDFTY